MIISPLPPSHIEYEKRKKKLETPSMELICTDDKPMIHPRLDSFAWFNLHNGKAQEKSDERDELR